VVISPQGCASRCRRAYILPLWFFLSSFSFSTPNLWGHWMYPNQTWTRIHLWPLFEKFGTNSPGHLPPRAGAKNAYWRPTLNFSRTCLCYGTWYQQSKRKVSIYREFPSPDMPQIWWTLVQKRLRTVGEFLPIRRTASLTTWTLYNRHQANFGTCYVVARAYSLEQQNAGQAQAGLCHTSSYILLCGEENSQYRYTISENDSNRYM